MSTLKVNKIENTATTDGGIEIDNTGHVQIDGVQMPTAGPLSNRNLVINGDMRVAQRGTAAVTAGGGRPVDRWLTAIVSAGTFSLQQTTANVPPGFTHALLATVTGADATTDAGDVWWIEQRLESQDTDFLQYATANAQSLTLSFWVRSSVSGTYCATITAHDGTNPSARSHVKEYTINSADTWEHKTLTFPGPTTGTVNSNTNTQGLSVRFGLVSGTNSQVTADTWVNVNATGTANQTQLLETLNANWLVTGVQLEVGDKATPFEHRSFGDELNRCKRYFSILSSGFEVIRGATGTVYSTANLQSFMQLPPMRIMPTLSDPDGNPTVVMSGRTSTFTVSSNWNLLPFVVSNQPDNMLVGFSYNNANNSGTNLPTSEVFLVLTEAIHANAEL